MKIFGKRLREVRKSKKITQQELADRLGIKRNTYSDWENGKTEPTFEIFVKLADLFDISLDWLFRRDK